MATRDDQRKIVKFARLGKLDGDTGLRETLTTVMKAGFTGEDLDFNEKPYFRSALWEATWKGYKPIVQLLAEKKANFQFQDYQGRSPLHEAAYYGHDHIVDYLVGLGADVNIKDNFGQSPLFRACAGSRISVIDYLLKKGAIADLIDCEGVSVSHLLGFQGQAENAEFLLYNGAWKNRYCVEQQGPPKPVPRDLLGLEIEVVKPAEEKPAEAAKAADEADGGTKEQGV